jgi:hypothetical protein
VTLKKNQIFGQGVEVQNIIENEQIDSCLVRHNSLEKNLNPIIPDLKSISFFHKKNVTIFMGHHYAISDTTF